MKKLLIALFVLLSLVGCGKKTPQRGPYSIGRDQSWFPVKLDLMAPNLNGFTNALVAEIAKSEDIPLQIVNLEWGRLFQALEQQEVAGIFTSLSPNLISEAKYSFSDPFVLLGPVLIVPLKSNASSLADLEGKIVAVNQFDESVLIVQKYPSIVIRLYQNKPKILEDLKDGVIDGVLMPILDAQALVTHVYSGQLKIVTEPLNNKALRIITLKGQNSALIKNFNRGLSKLEGSSKYSELRRTFQLF